jgi:netrin-G3 ligand
LLANISLWQNQYAFIHDAVLEALLCGDTQIPAFDLQQVVERLTQTEEENGGKTGFEQQFEVYYNFLVQSYRLCTYS